jgi:uncharacterized protein
MGEPADDPYDAPMAVESLRTGERLDLSTCPLLGRVNRLDRNRIGIELTDPALKTHATVADLVAFPTGSEFLIGLLEAVTQAPGAARGEGDEIEVGDAPVELRVMPIGTLTPGDGATPDFFRRGASSYPHVGGECRLIDGEQLHRFMTTLTEEVPPDERLVLGRYVADEDAIAAADGNRLFQRHLALVGSTGAGKSWAVALMLERAARLSHANLIVFDLHGEYAPLVRDNGGREPVARGLRVAGPADLEPGEERPADDVLYLPHWLLERDEFLALVLNTDDPHASDHVFRFSEHVQTLKQISLVDAGREDAVDTFTVDSPIPYQLDHLVSLLKRDDTERIPQHPSNRVEPGPYYGRLTGFVSRLEARAADPRYGFIFSPPDETMSYRWLRETARTLLQAGPGPTGIKIIDLSEVPNAVVPLVAGVLARLIYNVQFWIEAERRTPICLVCDEAHLYLPAETEGSRVHQAALNAFEAIAKEGRKYGAALVVVSQRPTDVSRTILSQCNNFVIMRLTNDFDQAMVERLVPETLTGVVGVLPALEPGEAVVVGDALLLPTRVRFDPPTVKPASSTQSYWSLWRKHPSTEAAIDAGVEALRKQLRPSRSQGPEEA